MRAVRDTVLSIFLILLFCSGFASAQTFSSSDLPIIVIQTNGNVIVDEPKVVVNMGIINNGPGQRNNINDPPNNYSGKVAIELRGSSSQMFPKKQYGFELIDAMGAEVKATLLGLPPESDWVLFAPYNDKTLMRDVLAYKLAGDLGSYAPRTVYCELVMDGQYQGIYVLIEKIKRSPDRVNINKLDPGENTGDDVTGGYIIKIDKNTGDADPGWLSVYPPPGRSAQQQVNFLYEYPKEEEITFQQREYIKNFMNEFEWKLKSSDFNDPIDGYARYIDVGSFIDFLIINEISKNIDGYRLSTFMHKQKNSDGGKLFMGPVWDFNLGFGNADYCNGWETSGMSFSFNSICPGDWWLVPFWWDRLLDDPSFSKKLSVRWTELRNSVFTDENILAYIDMLTDLLSESQQRNFQRWPVLGRHIWPNYFVGSTFQQEVDWLKTWIVSRNAFLDTWFGGLVTNPELPLDNDNTLKVYPNPSADKFVFDLRLRRPGQVTIIIYDMTGRKVKYSVLNIEGSEIITSGEDLFAGTYFFQVLINGVSSFSGKIIKR